jgi:uncharacterized protein YdhG (YjbR/CyaY superfamily)
MSEARQESGAIDAYIAGFPPNIQERLRAVRAVVRAAAPDAVERIAYGMPTFALHGNLVHFGAFKNHLGFYPTPSGVEAFTAELAPYAQSKGAIQFPHNQPLPLELIDKIVRARVAENTAKAEAKSASRPRR